MTHETRREHRMADLSDLYVIASGLDHPEGITTGPDGELYAGGEAGQVYRIDQATATAVEIANTGGFVLGLCHDAAGVIYLCNMGEPSAVLRVDPATGSVDTWCDSAAGAPLEAPNFPAFAPDGSLLFTDSGTEDVSVRNGRLIRVPPGGGDGEVFDLEPLHFPNGICLDAKGTLYVVETLTPRLSRVVGRRVELIADLPGTTPDGVALCADGGLVVACYFPFRLLYVPPGGGRVETVLDDPVGIHIPMPTNVSFYGEGLTRMAIGSLGGMVVKGLDIGLAGAPLHYPTQP
jgi:gluconolactonase